MAAAIAITRLDLSASELRAAAGKEKNGGAADAGLGPVLEGSDRTTAANPCGMDRRTLRDWVRRYNQDGLCGPAQPRRPGPRQSRRRYEDGAGAPG